MRRVWNVAFFVRIAFLMVFLAFPALGQIDIDNTCATCGRRSLDSINAFHINPIRLNQVGYRTGDTYKRAFVADPGSQSFQIIREDNSVAYSGNLVDLGDYSALDGTLRINGYYNSTTQLYEFLQSGDGSEHLYAVDFGDLSETGTFRIVVASDTSHPFAIRNTIYNDIIELALKFFGIQRSGDNDSWFHPPSHMMDGSARGPGKEGSLAGGWYDCGDHFKVAQTIAYTFSNLILAYSIWPEKAEDNYGSSYNDTLPFGTDGIPDILREAKIGADWVLALYDASVEDGLLAQNDMYQQVGVEGVDHNYWDRPQFQDAQPRDRGGPDRKIDADIGGDIAGQYTGALALFAKAWEVYDPEYSVRAREVAIDMYEKLVIPNAFTKSYSDGGFYPVQERMDDDLAWAAFAMWYLTGEEKYRYDLMENPAYGDNPLYDLNLDTFRGGFLAYHASRLFSPGGWVMDYQNTFGQVIYGMYKLIYETDDKAQVYGVSAADADNIRQRMRILTKERYIGESSDGSYAIPGTDNNLTVMQPYNLPRISMDWGFNRYNMGAVIPVMMYYDMIDEMNPSEAEIYLNVVLDNMNYILGLNPWDISFMIGAGSKNLQHIHHRGANPEGYNAGGIPYEYRPPLGAFMSGVQPGRELWDQWDQWTKTETCIDYSAQIVLVSQMLAEDLPPDVVGPALISVNTFPEDVRATITWTLNELSRDTLVVLTVDGDTVEVVSPDGLDRSKSVLVENLNPNTTYYFYIKSRDVRNNTSIHDNNGNLYHFTTTTTPITPNVSNVRVCNVDHESAQVTWWTLSGPSTSRVEYGTTPDLGLVKDGDDSGFPTLFHSVTLQQLTPTTLYYFDVLSNGVRDDNAGDHYQFTTSEVFVDYTIQIKPVAKGADTENTQFLIEVTNNETQPYTDLELRFYFSADAAIAQDLVIRSNVTQLFNSSGQVDPDGLALSFGTAQTVEGFTDVWYIPITIQSTLGVAERARFEFIPHVNDWDRVSWSQFANAWSVRSHTDPPDPEVFGGVDITRAQQGLYTQDHHVEIVNGVPEVTYVQTPYITAYYNGVHVYGYGPDYEEDVLQVRRSVNLNITEPQVTGPATQVNVQGLDPNYVISGDAFSTPDGEITNIIVNGQVLADSQVTSTSDTSASFVHPVILQPGTNTYDIVAWDDANCAFQSQKVVVNWIVAPPPQVATPQVTTEPAGNVFNTTMTIRLTTETPNAQILYTLDGSDPAGGTVYDPNNPIVISDTTQVRAIAIRDGWVNSVQLDTTFYRVVNQVAEPVADPAGTSFSTTLTVFLSTTTGEATILYTLDGNDPDPAGGGTTQTYDPDAGIELEATTTIKAIAVRDGWVPSTVTTESYVYDPFKVALPTADPFEDPVYVFTGTSAAASLDVILSAATDSATILYTLDGSEPATTPDGSITYEYTGPITLNATTTIKAIAVRLDWTPSDVLVANYEKVIVLPDALSARMLDLDGDGHAETVHVTFTEAVAALPNAITSVSWPSEGYEDKNAGGSQLSLLSDNIIAIDFSGDPFGFGLTAAGSPAPSLTLPGGVEVPIEDGVGPVITEASMRPPEIKQYVLESDPQTIRQFPDTLVLQLSEPLVDVNGVAQPWSDFLQYSRSCVVEEPGTNVLVTVQPIVDPVDPTVWKLPVESDALGSRVRAGNCVWLNGEGEYGDPAGNRPSEVPVVVTGSGSQSFDNFYTSLLVPIVGDPNQSDTIRLPLSGEIPVLDGAGNVTGYTKINDGTEWIPPLYMTDEGRINERAAAVCDPGARRRDIEPELFPPNCLSGIGVYSDGPYTAQVMIVDHLGKFIHSSTQSFGFCGELENEDRWRPGGYASFLIWNQKDDRGEYVASGVYLWKIIYRLQGGKTRTELYKQGIVRGAEPNPFCAVE